jgi:hypothetical protein
MAAGWGIVPYGAADWGSEGALLPGEGSLALTGQAPELLSGTVIQPDAGSLTASGAAPTVITGSCCRPRRWSGCVYGCGSHAVRG